MKNVVFITAVIFFSSIVFKAFAQNDTIPFLKNEPVQVTPIGIFQKNNSLVVKWESATGISGSLFILERSSDGEIYEPVVKVRRTGKSDAVYVFEDQFPIKGLSFYRIKKTTTNGNPEYLETIQIMYYQTLETLPFLPMMLLPEMEEYPINFPVIENCGA